MSIFSKIFGKGDGQAEQAEGENQVATGETCPRCGSVAVPGAAFCTECGTTLKVEVKAAPPPAPPVAARPPLPQASMTDFMTSGAADARAGGAKKQQAQATVKAKPQMASTDQLTLAEPLSERPPDPKAAKTKQGKAAAATLPSAPAVAVKPAAPAVVKPPAPKRPESDAPRVTLDEEDEFDAGFEAVVNRTGDAPAPLATQENRPDDLAKARDLFESLLVGYVRPIQCFLIELAWTEPTRSWVEVCLPIVRAVKKNADKLGFVELVIALDAFEGELDAIAKEDPFAEEGPAMGAAVKERLRAAHLELARVAPRAFSVDGERTRREPIIVQSLLRSIPDVHQVELDKIVSAGLSSLDMLFLATADDIAQTANVSPALAAQIVERFQAYRRDLTGEGFAKERKVLRELVDQLKKEHAEFEKASSSWEDGAKDAKKQLRRDRAATALRINVVLARLGEVDRVVELEKAPFAEKIRGLEKFLEESKRAEAALS